MTSSMVSGTTTTTTTKNVDSFILVPYRSVKVFALHYVTRNDQRFVIKARDIFPRKFSKRLLHHAQKSVHIADHKAVPP